MCLTTDQEVEDIIIGWTAPGEWLRYTVNVVEPGEHLTIKVQPIHSNQPLCRVCLVKEVPIYRPPLHAVSGILRAVGTDDWRPSFRTDSVVVRGPFQNCTCLPLFPFQNDHRQKPAGITLGTGLTIPNGRGQGRSASSRVTTRTSKTRAISARTPSPIWGRSTSASPRPTPEVASKRCWATLQHRKLAITVDMSTA